MRTANNMFRQLISLNKIDVECIQDLNEIPFGGVGEIWPVEAIGHVEFVDALSCMGQFTRGVLHA